MSQNQSIPNFPESAWDEWEIIKAINGGNYGEVYKAVNKYNGTLAAIKILKNDGNLDLTEIANEIQIMQKLGNLNPEHIIKIYDYKLDRDSKQILMELLGESVANYMKRKQYIEENDIIKLGTAICSALETCEKNKVVHRDIKPSNILITPSNDFKLCDFGIAVYIANTQGGVSGLGSELYMAPELFEKDRRRPHIDTYSLGLVLYQLANNNIPIFCDKKLDSLTYEEAKNSIEKRKNTKKLPMPQSKNISDLLKRVIIKACAFNPKKRFQTASDFHKALVGDVDNLIWKKKILLFIVLLSILTGVLVTVIYFQPNNFVPNAGEYIQIINVTPHSGLQGVEKISIDIEISDELKSGLQKITYTLHKFENGITQDAVIDKGIFIFFSSPHFSLFANQTLKFKHKFEFTCTLNIYANDKLIDERHLSIR